MLFNARQSQKAPSSISVTEEGILIFSKDKQLLNAPSSILSRFLERVISSSATQLLKAPCLILLTLEGRITFFKDLNLLKAFAPTTLKFP